MKRIFDCIVSVFLLVVFSPVIILIALLVRLKLGSPVFFRQLRPGRFSRPFEMIKFRTMLDAVNPDGTQLQDKDRLTAFGSVLRSTSLDELPGLWNVVKGDMSLVGPRPLLMEYIPLYTESQMQRHDVRPGITGWAQVNGRNAITWEEKFDLDIWYVKNQSFWLDIWILLLTIKKVFLRDGISAEGEVTTQKFTGSRENEN